MKKIFILLLLAVSVLSVSARDTYSRDVNVLPASARTVLNNNFKSKVSFIKIDKTLGSIDEYEVVLQDGSEITFDKNGNWKDIEVRAKGSVPSTLIPTGITNFVKNNQKKTNIVGIEKERGGYTVDLANGVEIKFDKNGNFVRYDN